MTSLLRFLVGAGVTMGVLLLMAAALSAFGGVGTVELAILFVPALAVGIWASRRVGKMVPAPSRH